MELTLEQRASFRSYELTVEQLSPEDATNLLREFTLSLQHKQSALVVLKEAGLDNIHTAQVPLEKKFSVYSELTKITPERVKEVLLDTIEEIMITDNLLKQTAKDNLHLEFRVA